MENNFLEEIAFLVEKGKINKNIPFPKELAGKDGVDEVVKNALIQGIPPQDILNVGLINGMKAIGEKFRERKVFVPDVLIAAKAMKAGMEHIKPFFLNNQIQYKGKIVAGTVFGDLHDIGKNILIMILQGGGWEVIDLGVNVNTNVFLEAVKEHKPEAVCLSALLTTTMVNMIPVVKGIKNFNPEVKVLVGGAPITHKFSEEISADYYSPHPLEALNYLNDSIKN